MADVKFKGTPAKTSGDLPAEGSTAPDFKLVASDLSEKSLADYAGKRKILSINHSLDTGTCQAATRQFNERVSKYDDVVVLIITKDLPFAMKRFCEAEGLDNVVPLSAFRSSFGADYGADLLDSPIKGLTARSIVVLDKDNKVLKSNFVEEVTAEPNYDEIEAALS